MLKQATALTVVKDKVGDLMKQVESLTQRELLVGISEGSDDRGGGEIGNAALGYIHEHGSPAQNIPERPFLVPGIRMAARAISARLGQGAQAALTGRADLVDAAFTNAGLLAQASVRRKITDGPFTPNAPATIARKGSDQPLVDTGRLREAVTYVIRMRGKGD